MKFLRHCIPQFKALPPRAESTTKPFTTDAYRHTSGFITVTGLLASLVALLLLVGVVMLASQMWQDTFRSSENAGNSRVSTLEVTKNIQPQNTLQRLDENIKKTAVVTTDASNVKVEAAVIDKQIPESQLDTTTDPIISAVKKPSAPVFKGDPAIYNQTISGRVLTTAGDIMPEIVVTASRLPHRLASAESPNDGIEVVRRILEVKSDPYGEFGFEHLEPGLYRISARLQDGDGRTSLDVHSGMKTVDLVLPVLQPVEITGRVTDEHGIPLEGVRVRLSPGKTPVHSDALGKFVLYEKVTEGLNYQVKFDVSDYESTYLNISGARLMAAEPPLISAAMNLITGTTTITGRITDIKGNLLSGQRVGLASPETNFRESVYTDQYGEFRFEQIIAGSDYRLSVSPDEEYRPWIQKDIEITPASRYFELVLERNRSFARLHGRVVGPDGDPIPHFNFTVKAKMAGLNTVDAVSDASGRYSVSDIPAGPVHIRRKGAPDLTLVNLYLDGDETRELDIPVDWGVNSFFGRVIDASGAPVKGARIKLSWSSSAGRVISQTHREGVSDADGRFQFSNLGPGQRSLLISSELIEPLRKNITIGHDRSIQVVVIRSI